MFDDILNQAVVNDDEEWDVLESDFYSEDSDNADFDEDDDVSLDLDEIETVGEYELA